MTDAVLFQEMKSISDKKIGIATLNSEKSLNALSLDMVKLLTAKLLEWDENDDIALIVLQGAGEKAFCAGGDVVNLYKASVEAGQGNYAQEVETFFTEEYKLDYLIHTYEKPVLLWGHGIVMGGGLGLMAGASHRVVTEKSRIAMPEVTIGLYPDVGGTFFLNRMPNGCGLFLGLTGASINAADALYVSLADHFVCSDHKQQVIEKLLVTKWGNTAALNHQKLTDILANFELKDKLSIPAGNIFNHSELISSLENCERVESAVVNILDEMTSDKWFNKAQASLAHGSALSIHLVHQQLTRGKKLTLVECFKMELGLSVQCAAVGEFTEGVRALLIDKDNKPNWQFETVHDVDKALLDKMFTSPWANEAHPLAAIG